MSWNNRYQQNNNGGNGLPLSQKTHNNKKLVLVILGLVLCVFLIVLFIGKYTSNTNEARAARAAREAIPNAEAKQVVVADGFAMAIVYVPGNDSQLGSGNTTIFRVNEDGSMTYIASASYFSPIDLLGFGIPFETQAKLRKTDVSNIKQELANSCDYGEDGTETPGFSGFDGSFSPDGWQVDSASLEGITQELGTTIRARNAGSEYDNKIVCIRAKTEGSGVSVDKTTFASTFSLELQFITSNGVVTNHSFAFTDGPVYSRTYTLDGKAINSSEITDGAQEEYTGDGIPPEEQ